MFVCWKFGAKVVIIFDICKKKEEKMYVILQNPKFFPSVKFA